MTRYYHPDEFRDLKQIALDLGFVHVESGPLVRSSYHAHETADAWQAASGSQATDGRILPELITAITAPTIGSSHVLRGARTGPACNGDPHRTVGSKSDSHILVWMRPLGAVCAMQPGRSPRVSASRPT